jgi:ribosomal protein S19
LKKVESKGHRRARSDQDLSRACTITPDFVGQFFYGAQRQAAPEGSATEEMVGSLREFAITRIFKGHSRRLGGEGRGYPTPAAAPAAFRRRRLKQVSRFQVGPLAGNSRVWN